MYLGYVDGYMLNNALLDKENESYEFSLNVDGNRGKRIQFLNIFRNAGATKVERINEDGTPFLKLQDTFSYVLDGKYEVFRIFEVEDFSVIQDDMIVGLKFRAYRVKGDNPAASTAIINEYHPYIVAEPFPIAGVIRYKDFIAFRINGDIEKLISDGGLWKTHITDRFGYISYCGEMFYLCTTFQGSNSKIYSRKVAIPLNFEGEGNTNLSTIGMYILCSKEQIFNPTEAEKFLNSITV